MCKLSFIPGPLLTLASISQWYQHKGARAIILLKQNCRVLSLLLGSMFFWSCLIQLNRSYKNNGKFARTGIATLNSHISKPVALCEKLKKINCNYFSILGLDWWFQNFQYCVFCHFWLIFWCKRCHIVSHFCPNMPLGVAKIGKKENLLAHKK